MKGLFNNIEGRGVITKRRKKTARNLRGGDYMIEKETGKKVTVKMSYVGPEDDGYYYAYPIINKVDGKWKKQSYKEARDIGEVFRFKNKKRAAKFAAGNWKQGKEKREAMRDYRKSKNK